MASRAAGCGYCMAHTAHTAERVGVPTEKENALWEYETSPLFSPAERAALRVAQGAAQVPNAVTDTDFAELKNHYSEAQIVDIVAVIALFGFLNRFNDTMATELETSPIEAGKRYLAERGWTVGKHAAAHAAWPSRRRKRVEHRTPGRFTGIAALHRICQHTLHRLEVRNLSPDLGEVSRRELAHLGT